MRYTLIASLLLSDIAETLCSDFCAQAALSPNRITLIIPNVLTLQSIFITKGELNSPVDSRRESKQDRVHIAGKNKGQIRSFTMHMEK